MIKKLTIAAAAVIGAILAYAATKPDDFVVSRALAMKAPAEKVAAELSDFKRWEAWSPWEKLDPKMKKTMSGPAAGKGAVYEWKGNSKVGEGRMEILEASRERVLIKLDFLKPFAAHNETDFTLAPEGDMTRLTWSMRGKSPLTMKVMGLFCDMDAMVGKNFEDGLASLKGVVEAK